MAGAGLTIAAIAVGAATASADPPPPPASVHTVDLSVMFHTRSMWRIRVSQGLPTTDGGENPAPGAISLCLEKSAAGPCDPKPVTFASASDASGWEPHYLEVAEPVYPTGKRRPALLNLVTASLHGGNGSQLKVTQILKYDAGRDAFRRIYAYGVGTNNNDEVRFVTEGPLRGDVISVEPTSDRPFAYWVVVNRLTPAWTYQPVLRFRSATTYGDGNRLAVIDSEMPNILSRLGLWKTGSPLPLPADAATSCRHPHLKRSALWCD